MLLVITGGCVAPNVTFEKIPPGIWRGALLLDRVPVTKYGDDRDVVKKFDTDSELPFIFEVVYDNDTTFHIVIHNADERIQVNDISFGRDKATAKDTVIMDFPVYDTQIKAIYEDGVMEGDWIVGYKKDYRIPFKAVYGVGERFSPVDNAAPADVSGKWATTFEIGTADEYKAVGVFDQKGNQVTGTFLTETGDYRYLEGKVVNRKLYLSAFDGAHAFLFQGKMMENGTLSGTFRSGSQYTTNWEASKDDRATLASAYDLTKAKDTSPLDFTFENESGKMISLNADSYTNKIKIIQIMGTWCPNCMDETKFLQAYFTEHPDPDVAIFSLGFERYKDAELSKKALKRFKTKMNISHGVLYAGYYDKKEAAAKVPQLDKIMSYPTMIITDKQNRIFKIHTGFSGPATPGYAAFKAEFTKILEEAKQK